MNYLEQLLAFERKLETDYLPGTSQLLWYKLMSLNNRCGWTEWFAVDNFRLMSMTDIGKKSTLVKYRDILIQKGYISYKKGKKNSPSKYRINPIKTDNSGPIWDTKRELKRSEKEPQKDTKKGTKEDTKGSLINKHKTKTETKIKEKNIQKRKFAEFVSMTDDEHSKLVEKYGSNQVKLMINKLDNYKGSNGKQYKSDYRAILNWVADEVQKGQPQQPKKYEDAFSVLFGDENE